MVAWSSRGFMTFVLLSVGLLGLYPLLSVRKHLLSKRLRVEGNPPLSSIVRRVMVATRKVVG